MKVMPIKPITEVLNSNDKEILIFTPLKEDEFNKMNNAVKKYLSFNKNSEKRKALDKELYIECKILFANIVAIGDAKIENRLASNYIEYTSEKYDTIIKKNFKCFVNINWKERNIMNLPHHEDGGSSWKCLISKLNNPIYGMIYNIATNDAKHFNLSNYVHSYDYTEA